jgi:hypothetical protein
MKNRKEFHIDIRRTKWDLASCFDERYVFIFSVRTFDGFDGIV